MTPQSAPIDPVLSMTVARVIQLVHISILIFVLTAWALPWRSVLLVHSFFVPIMILHWWTNDNRCFLTQLEARLRGSSPTTKCVSAPHRTEEGQFLKGLMKRVFGHVPSDRTMKIAVYGILVAVWTAGLTRFIKG